MDARRRLLEIEDDPDKVTNWPIEMVQEADLSTPKGKREFLMQQGQHAIDKIKRKYADPLDQEAVWEELKRQRRQRLMDLHNNSDAIQNGARGPASLRMQILD